MSALSLTKFRELAESGEAPKGSALRAQFSCDHVKAVDEDSRQIDFVISTEAPDRMSDVIRAAGWQLKDYLKNPVVLFGHDNREPPVAKAVEVKIEGKTLVSRCEFMPPEISAFSDSLFKMYQGGFMRATSVGFSALEWKFIEKGENAGGIEFIKQDLLEYSLVPVPANPEALMRAKSSGIDAQPLVTWAERVLDEWGEYKSCNESGLHVPRRAVEQFYKAGKPARSVSLPLEEQWSIAKTNLRRLLDEEEQMKKDQSKGSEDEGKAMTLVEAMTAAAALPHKGLSEDEFNAELEALTASFKDLEEDSPWGKSQELWDKYCEACANMEENDSQVVDAVVLSIELFGKDATASAFSEFDTEKLLEEFEKLSNEDGEEKAASDDEEDDEEKAASDDDEEEDEEKAADDEEEEDDEEEKAADDDDDVTLAGVAEYALGVFEDFFEQKADASLTRRELRSLKNLAEVISDLLGESTDTEKSQNTHTASQPEDDALALLEKNPKMLDSLILRVVGEELGKVTGKVS